MRFLPSQAKGQEISAILRAHHDLGSAYDSEITHQFDSLLGAFNVITP